MVFLRSIAVYFTTLFFMIAYWLVLAIPVLVILCLPKERRQHLLQRLLLWFGRITIYIVWRPFFRVKYRDLTGGKKEPGIVVVNHRAATDAFLVAAIGRNGVQTVNGWPMRLPVIGWMAHTAGYLNITEWDYETLKERARKVIQTGNVIVSYPEGTRSESRHMNPFHSGIFQVAKDLEVPVYMLCIAGNEYMPDRKFRFREFRDLAIRLLEPVSKEEVCRSATAYALKKKIFRQMEEELAKMDKELDDEKAI